MDYKYTIYKGTHIVAVDYEGFFEIAKGRVFKEILTKKFPDANGKFVIALKASDNEFNIETPYIANIDVDSLKTIPEKNWEKHIWGEDLKDTSKDNAFTEEDTADEES